MWAKADLRRKIQWKTATYKAVHEGKGKKETEWGRKCKKRRKEKTV